MNNKDIEREVQKAGSKITKEKVMDALRRTNEREFYFVPDNGSGYSIVRIPAR